jgi:aspartyl/glutamyl-tRNA(Asn/Gln) amidotransferase C subunit
MPTNITAKSVANLAVLSKISSSQLSPAITQSYLDELPKVIEIFDQLGTLDNHGLNSTSGKVAMTIEDLREDEVIDNPIIRAKIIANFPKRGFDGATLSIDGIFNDS